MISCREKTETDSQGQITMDTQFQGYWADTSWTYEFKANGQFVFKSDGHYGKVEDEGFYLIKDNLLFLNPNTDWHTFDGVLKTRLRILSKDCIRDFDNNYYCVSLDTLNQLNEKEWAFKSRVIEIVDTLQIVEHEKKRVASNYPENEKLDFEIMYNQIVVIDGKEFHEFNLGRYDIKDGRLSYLTFLAKKEPFEIAEYGRSGNEISIIYKE